MLWCLKQVGCFTGGGDGGVGILQGFVIEEAQRHVQSMLWYLGQVSCNFWVMGRLGVMVGLGCERDLPLISRVSTLLFSLFFSSNIF